MANKLALLLLSLLLVLANVSYGQQNKTAKNSDDQKKKKEKKLNFYGDFRFRVEYDWDSQNSTITPDGRGMRENRFRLRYRMRLGAYYDINKSIRTGLRLRTGVPTNMQSPHVNLGYKGFGMVPIMLDKVFLRFRFKNYWGWAGKNSFPFWKQNELFWDDDVMPEGVAIGGNYNFKQFSLSPTLAYFMANNIPVDGNQALPFSGLGKGYGNGDNYGGIVGAQIKAMRTTEDYKGILSVGYYDMQNIFTVNELLHDAGSTEPYRSLNYKFVMISVQYSKKLSEKWPLTVGYDFVGNLEDYTNNKEVAAHLKDQKTGHVVSISVGKSKDKGDIKFTYYYAYKQMYSVVSYYTEDDWTRWGNIHANRNTNFQGHEVRAVYTFGKKINVMARYYFVEGIKKRRANDDQLETGNRFRIEVNVKF